MRAQPASDFDIEHVEEEGQHVEMNVVLGLLEEQQGGAAPPAGVDAAALDRAVATLTKGDALTKGEALTKGDAPGKGGASGLIEEL